MEKMKLIVSIVERGQGAILQKHYGKQGIYFHTQCLGKGTATSEIMDILGLDSKDKDVVISCATESLVRALFKTIHDDLRENMDVKGIACSIPVSGISNIIANLLAYQAQKNKKLTEGENKVENIAGSKSTMIIVLCNRGTTGEVMATAKENGARGGTVIKARISGFEELEQAYDLKVDDNKDILAILTTTEKRTPIMEAINKEHGLKSNAQAFLFCLPVEECTKL